MKSLNPNNKSNPLFSEIYSEEILTHLKNEGFEVAKAYSYCHPDNDSDNFSTDYPSQCYKKSIYSSFDLHIYVFHNAIGIDVDYDCGGNSSVYFWSLDNYTFEEAYDKMVAVINTYR